MLTQKNNQGIIVFFDEEDKMNEKTPVPIPHQVERMIADLLNKRDSVHLRGNYRLRLDALRNIISQAIKEYDTEVLLTDASKPKRRK